MEQLEFFPTTPHIKIPPKVSRKEKLPTNATANHYPVHRWFNFIAGFSPEFVRNCIDKANLKADDIIIDPFAGLLSFNYFSRSQF